MHVERSKKLWPVDKVRAAICLFDGVVVADHHHPLIANSGPIKQENNTNVIVKSRRCVDS